MSDLNNLCRDDVVNWYLHSLNRKDMCLSEAVHQKVIWFTGKLSHDIHWPIL